MQQTANTNLEQELKEMKETNRDTPRVSDTKNDTFSNQTLVTSNPRQDIPDRNNTKKRKFRLFSCPDCDKSFTQQAHLSIHERKHTGERPYICGFAGCSKSFTQLGNLKTHERKHTGERPFQCSHPGCDKRFSQLGNMKTHEQLHLGVKPFQCPVQGCGKAFTQLGNLKSHQQKVHEKKTIIPQQNLPIRKRRILQVDRKVMYKHDSGLDILVEGSAYVAETEELTSTYAEETELLKGIKAVLSKHL